MDEIATCAKWALKQHGAHTTGQVQRLERVAAGKSDEELVIAGAPDEVVAAQVAAQAIGELLKDFISEISEAGELIMGKVKAGGLHLSLKLTTKLLNANGYCETDSQVGFERGLEIPRDTESIR